jgi:hypothetical protein
MPAGAGAVVSVAGDVVDDEAGAGVAAVTLAGAFAARGT